MQTNLGRCHYGYDDDATLIGARVDCPGWIGVCRHHRYDAERDGYVLHELVYERYDPQEPTHDRQQEPIPEVPVEVDLVGLDILDDPYPVGVGDGPLR